MLSEVNLPDSSSWGVTSETPGARFVRAFVRLIQTARIHKSSNRLLRDAAREFMSSAGQLLQEDTLLSVEARHSRIFVQGEKLLFTGSNSVFLVTLLSYFRRLDIHGLEFNLGFLDTTEKEVDRFVRDVLQAMRETHPSAWLEKRLAQPDYHWVDLVASSQQAQMEMDLQEKASIAQQVYLQAYNVVREISFKLAKDQSIGVRKPLRVVQELTDLVSVDKSILLGSMSIREHDDYTFVHSVNVAIESLCLGHEIGLSRQSLVRLGLCGLFHDLGKVDIPREILNKPGPLTTREFRKIKQHSLNSVRKLIRLQASPDLIAKLILPPFEHHLRYDLKGYPQVGWSWPLSLFGRIIQICDVYDSLTSSRVYREQPLSPDRAMGMMLKQSGAAFDPLLLKWFVNMHGVMPVGTVVSFNTGELGVVSHGGDPRRGSLPRVLVLRKAENGYQRGEIVDLGRNDPEGRRIGQTHHPSEFGIRPFLHLSEVHGRSD